MKGWPRGTILPTLRPHTLANCRAVVAQAAPPDALRGLTLEQVSDALNSELDDTDGGNDLVAAVLDRLAALAASPSTVMDLMEQKVAAGELGALDLEAEPAGGLRAALLAEKPERPCPSDCNLPEHVAGRKKWEEWQARYRAARAALDQQPAVRVYRLRQP